MNNDQENFLYEKPKVLLATPMYGGMCTGTYTASIITLFRQFYELGWDIDIAYLMNHSIITKARNTLATVALTGNFTHLLFIDADVSIKPDDVIEMIKADKPIIGGLYPVKEINWDRIEEAVKNGVPKEYLPECASRYVFNVLDGESPNFIGDFKLREVRHVGTGYMLIKREVLEKLSDFVPSYLNPKKLNFFGVEEPDEIKEFFAFSITDNKEYVSEDYDFCNKWISIGGKIYLAEWAYARHTGTYNFG